MESRNGGCVVNREQFQIEIFEQQVRWLSRDRSLESWIIDKVTK